jgi:N-glycosidase YbiA
VHGFFVDSDARLSGARLIVDGSTSFIKRRDVDVSINIAKKSVKEAMTIYFYGARQEPHGCFSNFSQHGFVLDDLHWPTVEHYFQAQKFVGTPHLEKVRQSKSPRVAARLGRSRALPLRSDWEMVKDEVMQQAVLLKFQTHDDIRAILLATENQAIVENSPRDYYWGCGKDGSGQNKLGRILMHVRAILREDE